MSSSEPVESELPAKPRSTAIKALGERLRQRGKSNGMRYNPFGLFTLKVVGIETDPAEPEKLFNDCVYTHVATGASVRMLERREVSGTTASDIRVAHDDGIDNTGNFHWPAEEILAHDLLQGKVPVPESAVGPSAAASECVLELGAGAALCGLLLHKAVPSARVIITDGNRGVVDVAATNAAKLLGTPAPPPGTDALLTVDEFNARRLMVAQLLWHRADELLGPCGWMLDEVDHVVAADCLFFDQYHTDLKALLCRFLRHKRPDGRSHCRVTLFAPKRGTTMTRFVDLMRQERDLKVAVEGDYDAAISSVHARLSEEANTDYIPERHMPFRIVITHTGTPSGETTP